MYWYMGVTEFGSLLIHGLTKFGQTNFMQSVANWGQGVLKMHHSGSIRCQVGQTRLNLGDFDLGHCGTNWDILGLSGISEGSNYVQILMFDHSKTKIGCSSSIANR